MKFFTSGAKSKSMAKSRLHFVLVQDRTGLTNEEMSKFKAEMVSVLEKYFVIDKQGFDIDYKRESDSTTLVINSPIVVRRQDGLHHEVGSKHGKKAKKDEAANTEDSVEDEVQEAAHSS